MKMHPYTTQNQHESGETASKNWDGLHLMQLITAQ